ncbi:translation initiation factor IF-2 subunit beta [Candidatus Altiarchaeales archaeon WOR_SM1_SCG]|nr:translation initiation factor IF-2 subunit beta [Candidatus Altiarchaeales archaeon WOR_SM1_SCG]
MEYKYENLLDRAYKKMPEKLLKHLRFEIPKADIHLEGNQTIIKNFLDISEKLGRDSQHLLTFLLKELATPGIMRRQDAVLQRSLRAGMINKRLSDYAKEYVLCHECSRPDTKITELSGQKIIKCEACGAWWPMRRIK